MSDTDQLRGLGQQLAAVLVASYGATAPGAKLVFLPGGVSVPTDLVQSSMVNPTQMQTWLSINFDSPFSIAPSGGSVLEKDSSYGSASRIYTVAVTSAQPLGAAGDPAWARVDGEIAAALRSLGQPDAIKTIVCEPDDWPLPTSNAGYWTKFDSTDTSTTTTQTKTPVPVVRPEFWMVRSLAPAAIAPAPTPPPDAATPAGPAIRRFVMPQTAESAEIRRPMMMRAAMPAAEVAAIRPTATFSAAASPASHPAAIALTSEAATQPHLQIAAWRSAASGVIAEKVNTRALFQNFLPVQTVTTSTASTIKVHLEHQCVTLGYYSAGQPWWDGTFLADQGWCVPGMARGGLLPPAEGADDATYGLPIGLVIVQNLRVSGQWSAEAAQALSSPGGTIGPLSLFGASASLEADGVTMTYAHDGMQVVALLCNVLPVLPPADAPGLAATTPAPSPPAPPSQG